MHHQAETGSAKIAKTNVTKNELPVGANGEQVGEEAARMHSLRFPLANPKFQLSTLNYTFLYPPFVHFLVYIH